MTPLCAFPHCGKPESYQWHRHSPTPGNCKPGHEEILACHRFVAPAPDRLADVDAIRLALWSIEQRLKNLEAKAAPAPQPERGEAIIRAAQAWVDYHFTQQGTFPSYPYLIQPESLKHLQEMWEAVAEYEGYNEPDAPAPHTKDQPQAAPEMFVCPSCGPYVAVDDDGCCVHCGRDTRIEPNPPAAPDSPPVVTMEEMASAILNWLCDNCETWNAGRKAVCSNCGWKSDRAKKAAAAAAGGE